MADFSLTKRVVFLIDLNPLLRRHNSDGYLSSVVSSAKALLSFPPLSSSLFSFKLFFSSLSPILSSSKLPGSCLHLSFDDPPTTLRSLSQCLSSLPNFALSSTNTCSSPQASNVAASLSQLLHDCSWDSDDDTQLATSSPCNSAISSNLVVLFSPIGQTREWLSQFISLDAKDEIFTSVDRFGSVFHGFFDNVNASFVSKGIHCSWVDVKCLPQCVESEDLPLAVRGIQSLGWGFCSTQSIVSGSVLVPFGLIYPNIGLPSKFLGFNASTKRVLSNLSLEITDVDGKPLECKLCVLQLVSLRNPVEIMDNDLFPSVGSGNFPVMAHDRTNSWLEQFEGGVVKVEAVQKQEIFAKTKELSSKMILVQEYSGKNVKDLKDCDGKEFFADRMLRVLASETGACVRQSPPIWQIFLGFMYGEGYWALISLTKSNGTRSVGVLKPFSISSAFISLTDENSTVEDMVDRSGLQCLQKMGNEITGSKNLVLVKDEKSQSEPLTNIKLRRTDSMKSRKNSKALRLLQDLTWEDFQKQDLEGLDVRMDELYFARESRKSKKLKFLKCWVKQVNSYTSCVTSMADGSRPLAEIPEDMGMGTAGTEANEVSEQPVSASDSLTAVSRVQGEVALDCGEESPEDILKDIPDKIRKGLESKEVDLGSLARRLVNRSIYCFYQKTDFREASECQFSPVNADGDCLNKVLSGVIDILLRDPKDLSEKNKSKNISSLMLDLDSSEYVVREQELQILFRMEILRSEISAVIKNSVKQKFIKQICSLLEYIHHLEGSFGEWSLDNYVEKIIKSRYMVDLVEVVDKIYSKMDLQLDDHEDEMLNSLLNSEEESGQSWRHGSEAGQGGTVKTKRLDKRISDENESRPRPRPRKDFAWMKEDHDERLIKARERRERARRVAAYTTWAPDLQRVWAPKQQPNAAKGKPEQLAKQSKRKDGGSVVRDIVSETPMTTSKRSCRTTSPDQDGGVHRSGSISKALFRVE